MDHWIGKYLDVFSMDDEKVLRHVGKRLGAIYGRRNVTKTSEYVFARGKNPIILVAHADTVFPVKPRNFSMENAVLKGVESPLGADDRAGVVAILKIVDDGLESSVLITTGEEIGGEGAEFACLDLYPLRTPYIIEMDRKGFNEAVFYGCSNARFKKYVLSFGFKEEIGTFSDISVLCPSWNIAGVNLSAGFYNEHKKEEFLNVDHLESTIRNVEVMLRQPPVHRFDYTDKHCSTRQKKIIEYFPKSEK